MKCLLAASQREVPVQRSAMSNKVNIHFHGITNPPSSLGHCARPEALSFGDEKFGV